MRVLGLRLSYGLCFISIAMQEFVPLQRIMHYTHLNNTTKIL